MALDYRAVAVGPRRRCRSPRPDFGGAERRTLTPALLPIASARRPANYSRRGAASQRPRNTTSKPESQEDEPRPRTWRWASHPTSDDADHIGEEPTQEQGPGLDRCFHIFNLGALPKAPLYGALQTLCDSEDGWLHLEAFGVRCSGRLRRPAAPSPLLTNALGRDPPEFATPGGPGLHPTPPADLIPSPGPCQRRSAANPKGIPSSSPGSSRPRDHPGYARPTPVPSRTGLWRPRAQQSRLRFVPAESDLRQTPHAASTPPVWSRRVGG